MRANLSSKLNPYDSMLSPKQQFDSHPPAQIHLLSVASRHSSPSLNPDPKSSLEERGSTNLGSLPSVHIPDFRSVRTFLLLGPPLSSLVRSVYLGLSLDCPVPQV